MEKLIQILSPEGIRSGVPRPVAPRLPEMRGRVIGLMDNNKPGGRELLEGLRDALAVYGANSFFYRRKAHPAGPSPYVEEVVANADAVVGALGD